MRRKHCAIYAIRCHNRKKWLIPSRHPQCHIADNFEININFAVPRPPLPRTHVLDAGVFDNGIFPLKHIRHKAIPRHRKRPYSSGERKRERAGVLGRFSCRRRTVERVIDRPAVQVAVDRERTANKHPAIIFKCQLRTRHFKPCAQQLRAVHAVRLRLVREIVGTRLGGRPIRRAFACGIHQHCTRRCFRDFPTLQTEAETTIILP